MLRSYLLAGNAAHYDGVIAALEARGLRVIPAFASGLDSRPAIDKFFVKDGVPVIDALVSLTGFSLVGGPAYNDSKAAQDVLAALDVPYLAAHPLEFQTLDQWGESDRGLLPVESTIMVAIPELDGATGPITFGGRPGGAGATCSGCHHACTFTASHAAADMHSCPERAGMLAARVGKLVAMRRAARAERKVGIVLFNFPPNAGNTGTAAHLSVFESLYGTLDAMKDAGYRVELPADVDALRESIINGNAAQFGALANVHKRIPANDHVRRERYLKEIEAQWGPAPGKQQSDGVIHPRARRALRQRLRRRTAGLRLRRRSDAPAVREGIRADARLLRLLPVPARGFRRRTRCCISAPTARWNSCPASSPACRARVGPTG